MVGVPGKYKGCNTCRLRRVKCDNQRPACKKCIDTGRECAGYERETVFIIGTIEDGGRCSSHPPRVVKSKKSKSPTKAEEEPKLELTPGDSFRPAWDDLVSLSTVDKTYQAQIAALHTSLDHLVRVPDEGDDGGGRPCWLQFPPYEPADVRPVLEDSEFELRAQCLVHLSPLEETQNEADGTTRTTDSICLFLYDHNNSILFNNKPPWRDPNSNAIKQLGPEHFRSFPNHHFFVRVYRHHAICAALLNRKPSFLAQPEWTTTPWELHPKSALDHLLDAVVLLPTMLARADRIFPCDPTLARRLMAQDLLGNCLNLERQLDAWYATVNPHAVAPQPTLPPVFWIEDGSLGGRAGTAQIPFADTFAFSDAATALAFVYYWAAFVLLYPCIRHLHETVFQPVVDAFPHVYPTLPAHLHQQLLDPVQQARYGAKEVRELASHVCRTLDYALAATVQPDMLVGPLFVVEDFYREISAATGDGQLELIWCEGFRARLRAKGMEMAAIVQGRPWVDLGAW